MYRWVRQYLGPRLFPIQPYDPEALFGKIKPNITIPHYCHGCTRHPPAKPKGTLKQT